MAEEPAEGRDGGWDCTQCWQFPQMSRLIGIVSVDHPY
jgi:hypothetical protein